MGRNASLVLKGAIGAGVGEIVAGLMIPKGKAFAAIDLVIGVDLKAAKNVDILKTTKNFYEEFRDIFNKKSNSYRGKAIKSEAFRIIDKW